MVISCPECSTRFNVADERLPDAGAKLRCARCRHVFMVYKPVTEEPVTVREKVVMTDSFPEPDGATAVEPTISNKVAPFPRDQVAIPDGPADFNTNDSEFDYDRFRELDTSAAAAEEFTFGNEDELAPPPTTAGEPGSESGKASGKASLISLEEQEEAKELVAASAKKKKPAAAPNSSAFSILIKAVLLIILAALIVAGVYIYLDGPEEINDKLKQFFGQTSEESTGIDHISLGTLEGRFFRNTQAGEIFLIRGEAINNFNQPRSAIQVKGVLYDQHGKPLIQKTVFCGNPISDEQLRTLSFEELEQMMGNQFGRDLSNMKIDPRKSIPFDIVFKDLPANIAEFSVNVTSSRPTER